MQTKTLVVEGWIDPFAISAAEREFKDGHYDRIFTTGGPVAGSGGYSNDYNTEASVGAGRLRAAGIPGQVVQMVPSHVWNRNRTYYSAVALRDWFQKNDLHVQSFNIVTEDAHARRTRLLFQEAFGKDVQVGIISVSNPDYNAKYWWKYSDGVREVIGETVAYIYAKFFFWPGKQT
ncbi:MAG TPA: ElyC/SanA/YdcF family protein [Verrucomicrobiae bacterium]|nr:ElyC/SanA/YdcF family protein [Verrucomicrobiae bacterium]